MDTGLPAVHLGVAAGGAASGLTLRMDLDRVLSFDIGLGGGVGWGGDVHWVVAGSAGMSMAPFGWEWGSGRFAPRLGVGVYSAFRSAFLDNPPGLGHGLYGMGVLDWRPVHPDGRMSLHAGVVVQQSLSTGRTWASPALGVRWRLGKKRD